MHPARPVPPLCNILILEPNRLCAATIQAAARRASPQSVIHVRHTLFDAEVFFARHVADLLITTMDAPDGDVIESLQQWRSESQKIAHVLVVTSRRDNRTVELLNSLHLHGVFDPAEESDDALAAAIAAIAVGERSWSPTIWRLLQAHLGNRNTVSRRLTPTQRIIFALMGCGCSDDTIASQLGMSGKGVESTRREVRAILEVEDQRSLVAMAIREGFVRLFPDKTEIPAYNNLLAARRARDISIRKPGTEVVV